MFQAALAKLEENCRQEMEKHKQLLDKEYEQLLTQFSKELEKLQLKHQEELGKRLKMNINTEKKLIKEVAQGHENEKKSFENKMKAEYKLKKERWKKEMESQETPKSQRNQGNAYCFDKKKLDTFCYTTEQKRKSKYFLGRTLIIFCSFSFLTFISLLIILLTIFVEIEFSFTFRSRGALSKSYFNFPMLS